MNVNPAASQPVSAPVDNKRAELHMLLLKKSLQSQQEQADQLLKQLEGKGQTIDLRV